MIKVMSVASNHRHKVVIETVDDEAVDVPISPSRENSHAWKPGEIHSSFVQKLSTAKRDSSERRTDLELPRFFNPDGDEVSSKKPPNEDLLDVKSTIEHGFSGLTSMQSIAMSVPAFLTILVLLTGIAFFSGRFSVSKGDPASASDSAPSIEPVSLNQATSAPVQGTPDEIIREVRTEFSKAIEASKKTDQTQSEKEAVSKSIVHVLETLGKAIDAYPDIASLFFERAQVEKMVMQSAPSLKAQAESDYKKAISLSPLTAEYYVGFADYHDVLADRKAATETYEKAIQLDPKNIDALYPLAKLYLLVNKKAEARELLVRIKSSLSPQSSQYAQISQEIASLEEPIAPSPQPSASSSGALSN
jgi:hypothetical protein